MPKPVIASLLLIALAFIFYLEPVCARNQVSVNIHAPVPDLPNARTIRQEVRRFISEDLKQFRKEVRKLNNPDAHGSFGCNIEKTFYSPGLVSIQLRLQKEFPYAAHPSDEIVTLNFDPGTGTV